MTHHNHKQMEDQIDARIVQTLDHWIEQLGRLCAQPLSLIHI